MANPDALNRPKTADDLVAVLPPEVLRLQRWVTWKRIKTGSGKPTKKPDQKTNDPGAWLSFGDIRNREIGETKGVGITLKNGIEIEKRVWLVALDFDACVVPFLGDVLPWAGRIVEELDSYTERSPSGTGLRVLLAVEGEKPPTSEVIEAHEPPPDGVEKRPEVQIFSSAGYVTISGETIRRAGKIRRVPSLEPFLQDLRTKRPAPPVIIPQAPRMGADEVKARVEAHPIGRDLSAGSWKKLGFPSASEAWFKLVRLALSESRGAREPVVDFLLQTPWGLGEVDSREPERYARRVWVSKDVERIAAKIHAPIPFQALPPLPPSEDGTARGGGSPLLSLWPVERPGWFQNSPPKRRYLLENLLPLGKAGTISGAGGTAKTFTVLQLAVSLITGRDFLGAFKVSESAPKKALLLLGEEDHEEVHRRIYAVGDALFLTKEERDLVEKNLIAVPLAGHALPLLCSDTAGNLSTTAHMDALRELLGRHAGSSGWGLVVIDPQARFAGVDVEKDNALATRWVQECEALTEAEGNPTVLVVAHSSKISRRNGDADSRGVTGLTDGFRWHATLSAHGEKVHFEVRKNNYAPPSEKVVLVRGPHGILRAETEEERLDRIVSEKKLRDQDLEALITRVLKEVGKNPGCYRDGIRKALKAKRDYVFEAIDTAKERGLLVCVRKGKGRTYHLAPSQEDTEGEGEGESPPSSR